MAMTNLDELFLAFEKPHNLMTIAGLYHFASPPLFKDVVAIFTQLTEKYPRVRQRVAAVPFDWRNPVAVTARWEDYPLVISEHVHEIFLTDNSLSQEVGRLMSLQLDRSKALWSAHLIHLPDGSAALLSRFHHAITDGQGSIRMILDMTKPKEGYEAAQHPHQRVDSKKASASFFAVLFAFLFSLYIVLSKWIHILSYKKKALIKAEPSVNKEVLWTEVPLSEVKEIKNALGCTVNDILVTILAGAIREAIKEEYGGDLLDKELLFSIPLSLRPVDDRSLANKSVSLYVFLPIQEDDPLKRLQLTKDQLLNIKTSFEASFAYTSLLLSSFSSPSEASTSKSFEWFVNKSHGVMTNVPGPVSPIMFAEKEVISYNALIPQSGVGSLGIGILSYFEKVSVSILGDQNLNFSRENGDTPVPIPSILRHFEEQLRLYLEIARSRTN
eukprot:TRINITY_DN17854_c0_g1_i1.p1 TRINITY_DN17854_c0_g1~~TRINITY_DN17854_c0_g1_i1.p1  ORF type:complete len:442 (-),score=87.04 TRINITY_DN17854_c0_g1_i1:56-1381(-)